MLSRTEIPESIKKSLSFTKMGSNKREESESQFNGNLVPLKRKIGAFEMLNEMWRGTRTHIQQQWNACRLCSFTFPSHSFEPSKEFSILLLSGRHHSLVVVVCRSNIYLSRRRTKATNVDIEKIERRHDEPTFKRGELPATVNMKIDYLFFFFHLTKQELSTIRCCLKHKRSCLPSLVLDYHHRFHY